MRALVFHEHGGPERLRIEEVPEPQLRPGDALIEVAATSLNGFDPMILAGSTGLRTPLPMIPCGDYAGRIVDFGPDTDPGGFARGDRVCPFPFVRGEGMFANIDQNRVATRTVTPQDEELLREVPSSRREVEELDPVPGAPERLLQPPLHEGGKGRGARHSRADGVRGAEEGDPVGPRSPSREVAIVRTGSRGSP